MELDQVYSNGSTGSGISEKEFSENSGTSCVWVTNFLGVRKRFTGLPKEIFYLLFFFEVSFPSQQICSINFCFFLLSSTTKMIESESEVSGE